jgi:transcriptional regulator with XRE-family HTH domain
MITPSQCRAGRGLLKWTQSDLAKASGAGIVTVRTFENEDTEPRKGTLALIQQALETAGVQFIPENGGGPGVRLCKGPTKSARPAAIPIENLTAENDE